MNGAAWYHQHGHGKIKGTKTFAVGGNDDVVKPGLISRDANGNFCYLQNYL